MKLTAFISASLLISISYATTTLAFQPAPFVPNIVDQAEVLSSSEIATINSEIEKLRSGSDINAAVYFVRTLGQESIEHAAEQTFQKWALGQKGQDNGLLLMFAIQDRKAKMEVGYGLEGDIPDIYAKQILDERILPFFKKQRYADGIVDGLRAVGELRTGTPRDEKSAISDYYNSNKFSIISGLVAFLLSISILTSVFRSSFRRRTSDDGSKKSVGNIIAVFTVIPSLFVATMVAKIAGVVEVSQISGVFIVLWLAWIALYLLTPVVLKSVAFAIGSRRGNSLNPVFKSSETERRLFLLDVHSKEAVIFKVIAAFIPGIFVAGIATAFWTELSFGPDIVLGAAALFFIAYAAAIKNLTLAPLISEHGYRRSLAYARWNRILKRQSGTREIFGRVHSYQAPTGSSGSSRNSSTNSSSSSSSGGGRSGGGGASSSW